MLHQSPPQDSISSVTRRDVLHKAQTTRAKNNDDEKTKQCFVRGGINKTPTFEELRMGHCTYVPKEVVRFWFYSSGIRNCFGSKYFSGSRFFSGIRKSSDSVFYLVILPSKISGIRIFSGSRIFLVSEFFLESPEFLILQKRGNNTKSNSFSGGRRFGGPSP
jgi:hypothetical protein